MLFTGGGLVEGLVCSKSMIDICPVLFFFQLFALQGESRPKKAEEMLHHKLPAYVQHMDRLGDTEL